MVATNCRNSAPRDGLQRFAPLDFTVERDQSGDGLTLEGYAAVFNESTEINNYEGTFMERIAPGAFRKTVRETKPVLQFDHGQHPMIGSLPIGKIETLSEDNHGLLVRARLHTAELFKPVREAIASGAIRGMSFRFSIVQDSWTDGDPNSLPTRTVKEVKLYELGPVVWPAYATTTVGVRHNTMESNSSKDVEATSFDDMAVANTDEPQTHSPNITIVRQRQLVLVQKGFCK